MMNKAKMKAVMVLNGDTQEDLAEALNLPVSGVNARINGKIDWRLSEMVKIIQRYHLKDTETADIFFEQEAS